MSEPVYSIPDCVVLRILDGDTVMLSVPVWHGIVLTLRVRMMHINAPELPTPTGLDASTYLRTIIGDRVDVVARGLDKYGRTLAELWNSGEDHAMPSLNARMISSGHAEPYMSAVEDSHVN